MLEPELVRGSRHAREVIESWRVDYNTVRPHSSLGYGRPKNLPRPTAVEKTVASPPWKTLRVSHFPTAATTAALFRPLQWNQKPWELRYDWTKNGGQVIPTKYVTLGLAARE